MKREKTSLFFEVALVLVRFDHVARFIVNADHRVMRAAVMLCVADCIIRRVIPQPTKRRRIRNQIDATFIFARAVFVNVRSNSLSLATVSVHST